MQFSCFALKTPERKHSTEIGPEVEHRWSWEALPSQVMLLKERLFSIFLLTWMNCTKLSATSPGTAQLPGQPPVTSHPSQAQGYKKKKPPDWEQMFTNSFSATLLRNQACPWDSTKILQQQKDHTNTTESFQNTTSKLQSQNAEGRFFATLIQEQRKVRSRQTSTTASKHLTAHSFCVRRCYLLQRLHLVILTGPQGQLYPTQSRTADTKTWTLDLIISK